MSKTKKISDNFFSDEKFFSRSEFCPGLHTAVVFRMQSFNIINSSSPTDHTFGSFGINVHNRSLSVYVVVVVVTSVQS